MTSLNLSGRSTGISPDFAPRKIFEISKAYQLIALSAERHYRAYSKKAVTVQAQIRGE
jgi:hypothetical protein